MQKVALDEYSKICLPEVEKEYAKRYTTTTRTNLAACMWIKSGLMANESMLSTNISNLSGEENDQRDMLKRWMEISPNLEAFLAVAKPGDIFLDKEYAPYEPRASQQFRNTPLAEPIKLNNGKFLVDIGFVDFGMCFDSINTLDPSGEPLTVIGYDASAQCVAKSLIMIQMMKDESVEARSVVEVWLSSLWTEKTFRAFKKATSSLLNQNSSSPTVMNSKVRSIVKFWSKVSRISKQTALDFQLKAVLKETVATPMMNTCALESEADRVDHVRYVLTKALYEDETTIIGSPVMCKSDDRVGVTQMFESCMEAVPFNNASVIPTGESFMNRVQRYFEGSMKRFMEHVRNGTLIFTPKLGILSPDNEDIIQEIKQFNPFLVHWSNVPDYIRPCDFHKIAKEISGPDTAHVMHSCNWSTRVYGTDAFDINPAVRLHFYGGGLSHMKMTSRSILPSGIVEMPPRHFRDVTSFLLCRKYVHRFFQYFFKDEDVNCGCTNGNTPLKIPSPFLRNDLTIHFIFAYKDTGITFGLDSYGFEDEESQY